MKKYVILMLIGLGIIIFALWREINYLKEENNRLDSNNTALMDKAKYFETEAGNSAASVQKLELSNSELRRNYQHVCQKADELSVKLKRIQAASTTATQTKVKVITQIRDSIVYRNGVLDSLKMFKWNDAWVDVAGEINGCDVSLDIVSNDTITQIIHRVPKKFLFFKWGCKAIRQEVVSSNPHTKITYTEYIELK